VRKATFYTLDEMSTIIESSHRASLRFVEKAAPETPDTWVTAETSETKNQARGRWFACAGIVRTACAVHTDIRLRFRHCATQITLAYSYLVCVPRRSNRLYGGTHPIMGPDTLVSNLWEVRDFWEWMFPGYRKCAEDSRRAMVVSM